MKRIIALFLGYSLEIAATLAVYIGVFLAITRGGGDPMGFPLITMFLATGMAPLAILLPAADFLILRRSWRVASVMRLLLYSVPVLLSTPFVLHVLKLPQSCSLVALTILPLVIHAVLVRLLRTMICRMR